MSRKHTKERWVYDERLSAVVVIKTKIGKVVAIADFGKGELSKEETEANAKLTAAAPELLQAAEQALHELEEWNEGHEPSEAQEWLTDAIKKATK